MTIKPSALVTYEAVAQACEALTAEGKRPSVRGIIAWLGGGSPNVVLDFQRQWKSGRPVVKATDIQVDPRIGQIVAEQIAQAVATARADIEAQLAEAEQDAETVGKAGREAEERASILEAELDTARSQVQTLTGQIDQLKADADQVKADAADQIRATEERAAAGIAKAEAEAERERMDREAAQVALAKAELRLEALPRMEDDLVQVRLDLARERDARVAAEQAAAVMAAELKAAERRANETEAREQAGLARIEVAAKELDGMRRLVETAREEAKKAGEEAAELRGRLTTAK
jgi:chromosome segregation ATPase